MPSFSINPLLKQYYIFFKKKNELQMEQLLLSAESSVLGPKKYILEQKLKNIIRKIVKI
jgi:hypothetical protein